jgi:hypothetical protein
MLVLVIAPFFTSFLIRTLAWQTILSSNGPVVGFFRATHLIDLLQALHLVVGDDLLSTPFAVVMGLTYNFLPFMVLPLFASLERIDIRLLEAGGDLYARPFTAFRKVTWPLSMPGVVAGTLLTFIPAAGDYINSKLLGNTSTTMIGQVIDGQFLRLSDGCGPLLHLDAHDPGSRRDIRAPRRNRGAGLRWQPRQRQPAAEPTPTGSPSHARAGDAARSPGSESTSSSSPRRSRSSISCCPTSSSSSSRSTSRTDASTTPGQRSPPTHGQTSAVPQACVSRWV